MIKSGATSSAVMYSKKCKIPTFISFITGAKEAINLYANIIAIIVAEIIIAISIKFCFENAMMITNGRSSIPRTLLTRKTINE